MHSIELDRKTSPMMSLFNFMGLGLVTGVASAMVLAGIVLLVSSFA